MTTTYSDAGVQFSDGTVQAVSAASAYRPSNLLGVVSQVAGVPTGAVIQRGSNANGEFVRWADGTQICTGTFPNLSMVANGVAGSPVQSFAAAFIGPIPVSSFQFSPGTTSDFYGCVYESAISLTTVAPVFRNGAAAQILVFIRYLAIGRWF